MSRDNLENLLGEIKMSLEELKKVRNDENTKWLTSEQVCEILKISKKTLQNYRDKGIIPFAKLANRTYYKKSDIERCLESHYSGVFSEGRWG